MRHLRLVGLVVLAAVATIGLAACGGVRSSPDVANLGKSTDTRKSSGNTPTTQATDNATLLLNEWAACMRTHGDPNQADPTIDADGVIHITWNSAILGGYYGTDHGQGNLGPGQYCRNYLSEAQTSLQGGQSHEWPSLSQLLHFAECMRANGIPDFPDPIDGNLSFNRAVGGDLNPNNPTFQRASTICVQRTGAHVPGAAGSPPPGTIEINGAS